MSARSSRGAALGHGRGAGLLGEHLIRRARRDFDPTLAHLDRVAHAIDELLFVVIVLPASAVVELYEIGATTLGEVAPLLDDLIESLREMPCRHGAAMAGR